MKMRIAHVTATFPPYRGGTGNVCFHNACELARRGHEVHVFTAALPGAAPLESLDGVTVHRLRPLLRVGNAPLLPGLLRALRGFDVIHLHYPFIFGAEFVRLTSIATGTPLMVSFHNDLIGDGHRAALFSAYQGLSASLTVRGAACLGVVSHDHYQSSRLHRALGGRHPTVLELPNGVDTQIFRPDPEDTGVRAEYGISATAPLLLFVAGIDRAHHFKRLDLAVMALGELPPEVHLLVVGDGDLRRHYEIEAQQRGAAARTRFVGAVEHHDTARFFRAADLTVLPSDPPESFGLVLIESLACGTPVVASALPGVRTVVADGQDGGLFQPGSASHLAAAIRTILMLPAPERRAMGLAGRRKVEQRYAWPAIGDRLEQIYRQVLESAGGGRSAQATRPWSIEERS
jgi:glycosyltransferase involved in cell wall biosynthesis